MDHQLELLALVAADRRRAFTEAAADLRLIREAPLHRRRLGTRMVAWLRRRDRSEITEPVALPGAVGSTPRDQTIDDRRAA